MDRPIWELLPGRPVSRAEIAACLSPEFAETIGKPIEAKVPLPRAEHPGMFETDPPAETEAEEPFGTFMVEDKRVHMLVLQHETGVAPLEAEWVEWERVDSWPAGEDGDRPYEYEYVAVARPSGGVVEYLDADSRTVALTVNERGRIRSEMLDERGSFEERLKQPVGDPTDAKVEQAKASAGADHVGDKVPANPDDLDTWLDTETGKVHVYTGGEWVPAKPDVQDFINRGDGSLPPTVKSATFETDPDGGLTVDYDYSTRCGTHSLPFIARRAARRLNTRTRGRRTRLSTWHGTARHEPGSR